jgi:hypothetical protein
LVRQRSNKGCWRILLAKVILRGTFEECEFFIAIVGARW